MLFNKEENKGNITYELQRLAVYDGNSVWPFIQDKALSSQEKEKLIQEKA